MNTLKLDIDKQDTLSPWELKNRKRPEGIRRRKRVDNIPRDEKD